MPVRVVALVACCWFLASGARADWDSSRTSSPDTLAELRELQTKIKATTARVSPATVGLLVGFGAGSGVIVSDDGLILTAAHVVGRPGTRLAVVLADGRTVRGKSLGVNAKFDTGMARITDKVPEEATWPGAAEGKWPTVKLGDSEALVRGQWMIALGQHGGPQRDRTPPLRVGRFDRAIPSEKILRSDCTLVGGDSGGPLFDLDGKLIGIHSRIGIFLDINLHVPITVFEQEWERLAAGEDIGRGPASLGISIDEDEEAPVILSLDKKGAAARAGLLIGDRITRFDGERIATRADLKRELGKARAGQEIEIEVRRGKRVLELTITLGEKESPAR